MKDRYNRVFPYLLLFIEIIVFLSCYLVVVLNSSWEINFTTSTNLNYILVAISSSGLVALFTKKFKIERSSHLMDSVKSGIIASFFRLSIFYFFSFLLRIDAMQYEQTIAFIVIAFISNILLRSLAHLSIIEYRKRGFNFRRALIIGVDDLSRGLQYKLSQKKSLGIKFEGFYTQNEGDLGSSSSILGNLNDLYKTSLEHIDYFFVSENISRSSLNKIIDLADSSLIKVKLIPSLPITAAKTFSFRKYDDLSVIDINNLPLDYWANRLLKRTVDIIVSLLAIVFILSWAYPLIGLLIKLESKGPIIFKQLRHGKNNDTFYCFKFRSMVVNLNADSQWAIKNDPRITKFGLFLRKSSLDELPQFINVLLGDMSIVGPRPHAVALNEEYQHKVEKFLQRHHSKPGITGLAQALGHRGEIKYFYQMNNRVKLDRFYLQNWSIALDIKIMFRTFYTLLFENENAY